jgi:pimeloyl-ACP methyl ester carboxylesterase
MKTITVQGSLAMPAVRRQCTKVIRGGIRALSTLTVIALCAQAPTAKAQDFKKYMNELDMSSVTMSMLAYGDPPGPQCSNGVTALQIQDKFHSLFPIAKGVMWTRIIRQNENDLQAVIYAHNNLVVVAFRGSCGTDAGMSGNVWTLGIPVAKSGNSKNWAMNYNGASNPTVPGFNGKAAHDGWAKATNVQLGGGKNFYEEVAQWTRVALGAERSVKWLLITGHSMGGAMAHYFAYRFLDKNGPWVPRAFTDAKQGRFVRTRILTFGAPKGGYGACGSNAASLEVDYNRVLRDREAFAGSVEIKGDGIPDMTQKSGVCPRTMGVRIVGENSFPKNDAHDIRNYMLIFARNMQSAYGRLPYSDMYNPLGSWASPNAR